MRAYGAELKRAAATSTRRANGARARRRNRPRYVHSANEPLLIAGVGTYALEMFEELPDADVILVPIGGGSGACGLDHRAQRARREGEDHRRRRRATPTPCSAIVEEDRNARRRRVGGHVRRRHGHARDLRPDVRHPQAAARRLRVADRRGAGRGRPAGAAHDAQPGRRRRRGVDRGGRTSCAISLRGKSVVCVMSGRRFRPCAEFSPL